MAASMKLWVITGFVALGFLAQEANLDSPPSTSVYMCDSRIYCQGPILETVNRLGIFNDSKHYVDMPLKKSQAQTLNDFMTQFPDTSNVTVDDLRAFLNDHFYEPGGELSSCKPGDWTPNPRNFELIQDENYRKWALDLHQIWLKLCRRINDTVLKDFDKNSLIFVPNNFIAPGGRFREYYYWDTYWIVKGLLVSQMYNTSMDIISNFAYILDNHDFIPNGGRVYYMERSQPPFFIPMVYEYYSETQDLKFLREKMPRMKKELEFWQRNRTVEIQVDDKNYTVYRYYTWSNTPRPEMFREDVVLASQLNDKSQRPNLYRNIATGAEAGLDFGSRYFGDHKDMITIRIADILPVDLNAILCWAHDIMHLLNIELGDRDEALKYLRRREELRAMIEAVFYNNTVGTWFDRDLTSNKHLQFFYPSNAVPLFTGSYDPLDTSKARRLYEYMNMTGALSYPSGIPSSLVETGQQWDLPNGWPPQNHMIIEGFRKSGRPEMQEHAFQLAKAWLKVNYLVYKKTGHMYEKYNVSDTTYQPGGGGEYEVQTGFGWTNGVVLDLLRTYGARLVAPVDEATTTGTTQRTRHPVRPTGGAGGALRATSYGLICSLITTLLGFFIVGCTMREGF